MLELLFLKKLLVVEITTSNYLMNDQLFQRILEFENNIPQAIVSLESLKKKQNIELTNDITGNQLEAKI